MPLVTVVAPIYNAAEFIEESILSVLNQTYPNIEYIIMDGGSRDGTAEIVSRYADRLTFISERDNGQTDAINKGWRRAKGDILTWLNADDLYLPNTVETAVNHLVSNPDTAWVYGYALLVDKDGKPGYYNYPISGWDYERLLRNNIIVDQPTAFLRRQIIEEAGLLDESLQYGMDYEYWLRIGKRFPPAFIKDLNVIVKVFRETKTLSGGYERLAEMEQIAGKYGFDDLPYSLRHQWVEVMLSRLKADMSQGDWSAFRQDFRRLWRFPRYVGHGTAKWVLRNVFPESAEQNLRRWLGNLETTRST